MHRLTHLPTSRICTRVVCDLPGEQNGCCSVSMPTKTTLLPLPSAPERFHFAEKHLALGPQKRAHTGYSLKAACKSRVLTLDMVMTNLAALSLLRPRWGSPAYGRGNIPPPPSTLLPWPRCPALASAINTKSLHYSCGRSLSALRKPDPKAECKVCDTTIATCSCGLGWCCSECDGNITALSYAAKPSILNTVTWRTPNTCYFARLQNRIQAIAG